MKILQLNCVYKEGSTGKIVDCIGQELRKRGHEVFTCYGIGKGYYDDFSQKITSHLEHNLNALWSRISGIPYGGLYLSNIKVQRAIKEFRPEVVHVHCINASTINVYNLLRFLAKNRIKTIVTLHAEIFHTAGCSHAYECEKWKDKCHDCDVYRRVVGSWFFDRSSTSWQKMFNAFNGFKKEDILITAVSPWLAERAKNSGILRNLKIVCIPNGLDASVFHYREVKGSIDNVKNSKTFLFVTPYFSLEKNDIKGGCFLPQVASSLPNYNFKVIASRTASNICSLPSNIQLCGSAKSQEELARLYSESDVTLLLSRRETFSMVTAESLCCGTPVVGFSAGGPESIAIPDYTKFVEYGNVGVLISELQKFVDRVWDKWVISLQAISKYSSEEMANKYLHEYNSLL